MKLREIRTKKGITQDELAKKCDVSQQAICNYEARIREPNLETLKKLATALECTVDELLEEAEDDAGRV